MPTLYVENIPKDLYDALRATARLHKKSISAEVTSILQEHIATPAELKARRQFLREMQRLRSKPPLSAGPFPSSEEMTRQDRSR
jgi:plasmid stability protein